VAAYDWRLQVPKTSGSFGGADTLRIDFFDCPVTVPACGSSTEHAHPEAGSTADCTKLERSKSYANEIQPLTQLPAISRKSDLRRGLNRAKG